MDEVERRERNMIYADKKHKKVDKKYFFIYCPCYFKTLL